MLASMQNLVLSCNWAVEPFPELSEQPAFTLCKLLERGSCCITECTSRSIPTLCKTMMMSTFCCRMQAQRPNSSTAYKGMSGVFRETLRLEGVLGFYKGILPNLLKVVPSASITYLVYETMKKSLSLE